MAATDLFESVYAPPLKQGGRGWRQQSGEDHDPSSGEDSIRPSRLAMGMLLEWCEGHMSARQIHYHMRSAVIARNIEDPLFVRLANFAGEGHSAQHCNEKVMGLLEELDLLHIIDPIAHSSWKNVVRLSAYISLLVRTSPRDARLRLGADKALVRELWTDFLKHPTLRNLVPEPSFLQGKSFDELCSFVSTKMLGHAQND